MKKLTRSGIEELREEMSVLSPDTQKEMVGRSGPYYTYYIDAISVTAYTSAGAQHFSSVSDYLYSMQSSRADAIASGVVPMVGLPTSYIASYLSNQEHELAGKLVEMGYNGAFYTIQSIPYNSYSVIISAYNTKTGQLIYTTDPNWRYK